MNSMHLAEIGPFALPVLPRDALKSQRMPEVSLKLLAEVIENPEGFGSDGIKNVISYVQPEIRNLEGMTKAFNVRLTEPSNEGPWDNCFDVGYSVSVYDKAVCTKAWINLNAVRLNSGIELTEELLKKLPLVGPEYLRAPEILLQDGSVLFIQSGVLRNAKLWLSHPNYESSNDSPCIRSSVRRRKSDGFEYLHVEVFDAHDSEWNRTVYLKNQPIIIDKFEKYTRYGQYVARIAKYRSEGATGVRLENYGPAEFRIYFK